MNKPMRMLVQAAVVLSTVSIAAAAQAEAEFKLRWGHYLGNSKFLKPEQDFAKAIEERTKGRVTIEIAYAGALGKGNEVLTLAGRGAIDMASVVPGYYADQLRFWKAFQIPFVFSSPKQAIEVSIASYKDLPPFKAELDKMNVRFLFHQPLGQYYLTGPSPDCDSVDGLKGKKVRSFGADIPQVQGAIGAVPVTIGVGDIYEALQRGSLDYSFLNPGNIEANKLYEPGKYSCGPIMSIAGHLIVIGNRTWDRLPKDIQDIFIDQAAKSQAEYIPFLDTIEGEAMEKIKAGGGVFKPFPAAEMAKWRKASPDLLAAWVKGMEADGRGAEAEAVAKRWRELTAN
ncbi:C4-dicarboxylate TRAP transporter substrate-binding protein [Thalassobaculum sp.]|uniref:C4-dicarboxylate TRAP transporter substrate-binding protein n=1 Tax=Thalassobaculum sp. TaxID=2022740 RepID=UPI0032EBEDAA